jgi:HEAT repeat protein
MSRDSYQNLSTQQLLDMFVGWAKTMPTIYSEWPEALLSGPSEKARRSPERDAKIAKVRPLAAAIIARKPIAEVRRLFEDQNLDVRAWATGALIAVDPEWATASLAGLMAGLKTRDVLAQRKLARQKPPFGPPIETLSDDELVARFKELGEREDATRFLDCIGDSKDMDIRNAIVGQALDAMRAIKARGLLERLLPLLDSDKVAVRFEAALACMRIAPEKATAVLERIVACQNPDYLGQAQEAINCWRANKRVVYGM